MNKYEKLKLIIKKYESSHKGKLLDFAKYDERECYPSNLIYFINGNHKSISYHELLSIDSGLMEAVKWRTPTDESFGFIYIEDTRVQELQYHYMAISMLTANQKLDYFLANIDESQI